jgi:uncharacterized GH25 family protein
MTMKRLLIAFIAIAISGATLTAHDLWIEPSAFAPDIGKIVGVRLRVGQDFLGDPIPREPSLIDQFIAVDSKGARAVAGQEGGEPAGLVRIAEPGLLVIGYHSRPTPITIDPAKFNQYLKDEGLDAIVAERARRGETATPARELFSRCAKSLVLAGRLNSASGDRPLGFTLELVAERNPYTLTVGDELPVKLMYNGRPLAGALVIAMNRQHPSEKASFRSDMDGRVRFRLKEPGMWLIKAVHMIPAPAGANAEWVSFWASSTFELGTPR